MAPTSANRLQFTGEAIPFFIKSIIAGLSTLIYVPAPAQFKALLDYFFSNVRFPDGTVAKYDGTGDELKQPLLYVTILIWANIILSSLFSGSAFVSLGVGLITIFANAWVSYQLITVVASRIITNHGSRLNFAAPFEEYLKWQLLISGAGVVMGFLSALMANSGMLVGALSVLLSVAAFAFSVYVAGMFYKWQVSRYLGGSRTATYMASPIATAIAIIVAVLSCFLIITIPWVIFYFSKWFCEQIDIPVKASAPSFGGGPGFGTPPPSSGPGYSFGANAS